MSPVDKAYDELRCLPWAGEIVFGGYGARIGVRFTDRIIGEELARRPSPGTRLTVPGRVDRTLSVFRSEGRFWIYGDDEMKCQPALHAELLDAFDTHLRASFAEFSRSRVFVHAGAVGWNGKAIVFPGSSRAGKSTLIARLVESGASYLSDEYAVFDVSGRVHPFGKPLSLRDPLTSRQRETPVEALGGVAERAPLPVGLVVLTRYRDGARWRPNVLSRANGALEIMAHAIAARRDPALALAGISAVVERARVIRSDRGEASGLVDKILAARDDAAD